jgi:hypothetical protein
MKLDDQMPPFFIRGWNEDGTEEARTENIERVQKYHEVLREWSDLGLTGRVSEVNLLDVRDVRAQLAGSDSQIEVRFSGSNDLGHRLKIALEELDRYKQSPRGFSITYIAVQADRVVFGYSGGVAASTNTPGNATTESPTRATNSNTASDKNKTEKRNTNDNRRTNDRRDEERKTPAAGNNTPRVR